MFLKRHCNHDATHFRRKRMTTHAMPGKTLRLVIYGHVQGVYFRDSMRREAQNLGVSGWARNCGDGTVEAVVQGMPADVDAIVRWAHHGPQRAQVERVEVEPHEGGYSNFEIIG
jgi:acylphosphatase